MAVNKSCPHQMSSSLLAQVRKCRKARYPDSVTVSSADKVLKAAKSSECTSDVQSCQNERKRMTVMPCVHKLSHRFKKVGAKYGVNVLFSAPNKLSNVGAAVQRKIEGHRKRKVCNINHVNQYVQCRTCIVYQIPLSCGSTYIGHSGRCINVRLMEHANSLEKKETTLANHCFTCKCTPYFVDTEVLFVHNDRRTREVAEAFHIIRKPSCCVSTHSVSLTSKEMSMLHRE